MSFNVNGTDENNYRYSSGCYQWTGDRRQCVEAGTTNGTITDLDGKFSLNVSQGAKINVSYIGYKTQTITTGVQNSYQIVLKEDTEVLDEVVVTGYGGSQKRAT